MLTERDAQIVDWLGRIGAAGAMHVSERFGMHLRIAHERLRSLIRAGMLEHDAILWRRPGVYLATRRGLRWQGLGRLTVARITPGGFEHAWQVATTAVALHGALPEWRLLGEREIRALEIDEGKLIASARLNGRGDMAPLHRPDLALVSPSGRVVAIEVERAVKAPARLRSICRGWARARHVSCVYYLAAPPAGRAVSRAVDAVRAQDRVAVLASGDVTGLAARELAREEEENVCSG